MRSSPTDTIVALATPPGRGALAIVRLSGPESLSILRQLFPEHQRLEPRRQTLGRLVDGSGEAIDQVMATWFAAPHSYTGEEVVEISCHGSPVVAGRIIETFLERGARPAEPGEFTLRAVLNGKMDLAQAEAVRDLIEAQTGYQAQVAREQLEGRLSRRLAASKERLAHVMTHLETRLEFVEDEVEPEEREELAAQLQVVAADLEELTRGFRLGRLVHEGVQIAVVGKPNAGKSSIFNALLQEERAIVTEVAGTTRDAVSETVDLHGISARLFDTAGIRRTEDRVELLGVERTRRLIGDVEAAIFVIDQSTGFEEADWEVWTLLEGVPVVLAVNKQDLAGSGEPPEEVSRGARGRVDTSVPEGRGIEAVREALHGLLVGADRPEAEIPLVTSLRHQQCVQLAREALMVGLMSLKRGASEEFVVEDLRRVLAHLGEITGEVTPDDVLQRIFSTLCIGK